MQAILSLVGAGRLAATAGGRIALVAVAGNAFGLSPFNAEDTEGAAQGAPLEHGESAEEPPESRQTSACKGYRATGRRRRNGVGRRRGEPAPW